MIVRLTIRTVLYSLLIVNSLPVTKDQMENKWLHYYLLKNSYNFPNNYIHGIKLDLIAL